MRQMLHYMEETTFENAVNEELREIHRMVETVKKDPEVGGMRIQILDEVIKLSEENAKLTEEKAKMAEEIKKLREELNQKNFEENMTGKDSDSDAAGGAERSHME